MDGPSSSSTAGSITQRTTRASRNTERRHGIGLLTGRAARHPHPHYVRPACPCGPERLVPINRVELGAIAEEEGLAYGSSEPSHFGRAEHRLCAIVDSELSVCVVQMGSNGAHGQSKFERDDLVNLALRQNAKDCSLALRQR